MTRIRRERRNGKGKKWGHTSWTSAFIYLQQGSNLLCCSLSSSSSVAGMVALSFPPLAVGKDPQKVPFVVFCRLQE